jgi:AcrR family transcriptional regulator
MKSRAGAAVQRPDRHARIDHVQSTRSGSHRRARPRQARSRETVDRILESAIGVLTEHGLQGFNTNMISHVAGVNVATLYHYFPDKNAILLELFDHAEQERSEFLSVHLAAVRTTDDLDGWARQMAEALRELRRRQPAGTVLRRACRAVPELLGIEQLWNERAAEVLRDGLRERFPHLSKQRAQAASRAIVQLTTALLDHTSDHPRSAKAMSTEFETLLFWYLHALSESGDHH